MLRWDRTSGKSVKTRRCKTLALARPDAPKPSRRRGLTIDDLQDQLNRRTRGLSEALEQQVISSSPRELERVFQAMLANAVRICGATFGMLFRFEAAPWRDQGLSLRARLYAILRQSDVSAGARQWRKFDLTVIAIGLLTVALAAIDDLPPLTHGILIAVTLLVSAFFLLEYLVRLWVAPEAPSEAARSPAGARLRWALSIRGLIGLLAVIPAVFIVTGATVAGTDAANVFGLMWILKLGLHAPAMGTLARVVSNERARLASILIIFLIVLVAAATAALLFEHKVQPDRFGNLPDALWWAVVTLTTVGYGDVVPATVGGKIIGAVVMVCGIAVLALMTGVLASGFAEEERRREYIRVWEQVLCVPMFAALGVATLSEIVSKLRTRHYPAHIAVVRRGDPGDSMFFISSGEVEVRLPHRVVRIEQGGFFGEMALLDREPRSATVITTKPTTLLVLFASDFYQIASKIPSLAEVIETEAKRRQSENKECAAQLGNPPSDASLAKATQGGK